MYKKDEKLGRRVQKVLMSRGLETPIIEDTIKKDSSDRKNEIVANFAKIMKSLGMDLSNDSLIETPERVAKMFIDELFWGLDYANFPKITTNPNEFQYDNMLIELSIPVKSMCEHHFVPIKGVAHVAYIPDTKVVGLSKLNRVVHFFSRRPQVQERLNKQILVCLQEVLETKNVAVSIIAEHLCVSHRGVGDHGTNTITTDLGGEFFTAEVRKEFFDSIKMSKP